MPDGLSAALRQHDTRQTQAESRFDHYAPRVIEALMDKFRSDNIALAEWVADHCADSAEVMGMWLAEGRDDEAERARERLRSQAAEWYREWLETERGQELVEARVNTIEESREPE